MSVGYRVLKRERERGKETERERGGGEYLIDGIDGIMTKLVNVQRAERGMVANWSSGKYSGPQAACPPLKFLI